MHSSTILPAAHDTDSVVRSLQTRRREEGSTQATKEPSTRTQRSDLGHAGRAVPSHSSMGLPWQRAARDVYGMGNGESLGGTEEQQRSAVAPQSKVGSERGTTLIKCWHTVHSCTMCSLQLLEYYLVDCVGVCAN